VFSHLLMNEAEHLLFLSLSWLRSETQDFLNLFAFIFSHFTAELQWTIYFNQALSPTRRRYQSHVYAVAFLTTILYFTKSRTH
jgi:hypothetical protein